jgi:hypothetical protein
MPASDALSQRSSVPQKQGSTPTTTSTALLRRRTRRSPGDSHDPATYIDAWSPAFLAASQGGLLLTQIERNTTALEAARMRTQRFPAPEPVLMSTRARWHRGRPSWTARNERLSPRRSPPPRGPQLGGIRHRDRGIVPPKRGVDTFCLDAPGLSFGSRADVAVSMVCESPLSACCRPNPTLNCKRRASATTLPATARHGARPRAPHGHIRVIGRPGMAIAIATAGVRGRSRRDQDRLLPGRGERPSHWLS